MSQMKDFQDCQTSEITTGRSGEFAFRKDETFKVTGFQKAIFVTDEIDERTGENKQFDTFYAKIVRNGREEKCPLGAFRVCRRAKDPEELADINPLMWTFVHSDDQGRAEAIAGKTVKCVDILTRQGRDFGLERKMGSKEPIYVDRRFYIFDLVD